jgi:hypothetical protein
MSTRSMNQPCSTWFEGKNHQGVRLQPFRFLPTELLRYGGGGGGKYPVLRFGFARAYRSCDKRRGMPPAFCEHSGLWFGNADFALKAADAQVQILELPLHGGNCAD